MFSSSLFVFFNVQLQWTSSCGLMLFYESTKRVLDLIRPKLAECQVQATFRSRVSQQRLDPTALYYHSTVEDSYGSLKLDGSRVVAVTSIPFERQHLLRLSPYK